MEKHLPVAAGLGGGSGDAAAALRGLNRHWQLDLAEGDLMPLARDLGADVPVCLAARPARMRGVGERLEWLGGLPALALLLVNPDRPLATAAVFGGLGGLPPPVPEQGPPPQEPGGAARLAARPRQSSRGAGAPAGARDRRRARGADGAVRM